MMIVTLDDDPTELENGDIVPFSSVDEGGDAQTRTLHVEVETGDKKVDLSQTKIGSGFEIISKPNSIQPGETKDILIRTVTTVPGEFSRDLVIGLWTLQLQVEIAAELPQYTTRSQLERMFGRTNVLIWADLDGNRDENDVEATIYQTIKDASREIDAYLSAGSYTTPFESPIPSIIASLTASRAGILLYTSRGLGIEQFDRAMSTSQKRMDATLEDIRRGRMLLPGVTKNVTTNGPVLPDPEVVETL